MDIATAEQIVSKALRRTVKVLSCTIAGSGYHSTGYRVLTDQGLFFLKQLVSADRGFEFPERKIASLLLSHGMNQRAHGHPRSYAIVTREGVETNVFTKVDERCEVYEVQDFIDDSHTLLSTFASRKEKTKLDDTDRQEIRAVIDFLNVIHATKPAAHMKVAAVYNDYLRSVIGHPEYTLQLLHPLCVDDPVLPLGVQQKMLGLMLAFMHRWKDRGDRLRLLHGDLWVANCLKTPDGSYRFIDYSRMPWGDPGFDVGFWTSSFYIEYLLTRKPYFKNYLREFLRQYEAVTGDQEIRQTLVYAYALVGIMYGNEQWVPGYTPDQRKKIIRAMMRLLKTGRLQI